MPFPTVDGTTFEEDFAVAQRYAADLPPDLRVALERIYRKVDLVSTALYDAVDKMQTYLAENGVVFSNDYLAGPGTLAGSPYVPIDLQPTGEFAAHFSFFPQPPDPYSPGPDHAGPAVGGEHSTE